MTDEQLKKIYDKINELVDTVNTLKGIIATQDSKIRILELNIKNVENMWS